MQGITIAVLGHGPEACEVARARACAGHVVRVWAPHAAGIDDAIATIRLSLERLGAAGGLTDADRERTLGGIVYTTDLEEALAGAGVVIDARYPPPS